MRRRIQGFSQFAALPILASLLASSTVSAQLSDQELWSEVDEATVALPTKREILPERYRILNLDLVGMRKILAEAPLENSPNPTENEVILSLPLPEGGFGRFRIMESPIMEPGLAAKFPEIKTYRGQGIDHPAATLRFDRTPAGFHAMILSPAGNIFIDPHSRGDARRYITYRSRDLKRPNGDFECLVQGHDPHPLVLERPASKALSGTALRTYRLAVAATGEYTAFHGGTVAQGQAAIVTAMNRVNGIYERDVAIRMVLVANNDQIVYTNAATDPYSNGDGIAMLSENQSNVDAVIGNANYDIGHVFSTGGGGVASLRVPCVSGSKARGVTGQASPTGDPFWVDYVSHELGHQWGGNHTFNGSSGNCSGGNRNGSTAYEPGSGSTIMAYAGICDAQDLQPNSDDYFHGISLDEIIAYSATGNGNSCAAQTATGNNPPTVNAGGSFIIPVETPFELCGSATDPEGDPLTYAWEEFDLGPTGAPGNPSGNAPIFRTFDPTPSPCRTFPRLGDLLANTQTIGELLPTYARTMNFRLTARDNRSGGGGVADDATTVTVSDVGGPFQVTAPNTAVTWQGGSAETVSWNVAGTDLSPIGCSTVDILLSTDGGLTYPIPLSSAANNGSRTIAVPSVATITARLKVRCAGNIFFDISDTDFTIEDNPGAPSVTITAPADGTVLTDGDSVTFSGTADDPEDGDLSSNLSWTSSLDGTIGSGASFSISTLSVGTHTITASVSDSDSNTATDQVTVTVELGCVNLLYSAGYESSDDGWVDGASTCTTGTFLRGTPDAVSDAGVTTQVGGAATGTFAWFTQNNAGGVGTDDVDGGTCETLSPAVNVGAGNTVTAFLDYYHGQRDAGDDAGDGFTIELINADTGAVLATLASFGDVTNNASWTAAATQIFGAPNNVRLRVRVSDAVAGGDLVEGGIDNVRICSTGGGGGCTSDAQCDDGLFCNGAETCDLGTNTCQSGTPVACNDGVSCTVDSCNEASDSCNNLPNDALCDNGLFCDGAETCDAVNGCQASPPVHCDDGVSCTADSCNEASDSCDNLPDDGLCDNGLFCDGAETCDAVNGCQAGSDPCFGATCDEATDACLAGDCFYDVDFESGAGGWSNGADSCIRGAFVLGSPDATAWQAGGGNPGDALFTQPNAGGVGRDDVDRGTCEALSPSIDAGSEAAVSVSLDYFHGQRDANDDPNDGFTIEVLSNGLVVDTLVSIGDVTHNPSWTPVSTTITNPGTLQLRVRATDGAGAGDIIEAGIDNIEICPTTPPVPCTVEEDFSGGLGGWVNAAASTCTTGTFVAAVPTLQASVITTQVGGDHTTGAGNALFTATNTSAGLNDVDRGICIVESPTFNIAEASDLSIWYFHGQRDTGDDAAGDFFLLEVSTNGGVSYSPLVSIGDVRNVAAWTEATAAIPAGSDVRLRLQVSDGAGPGDIIEAGLDDLSICPSN